MRLVYHRSQGHSMHFKDNALTSEMDTTTNCKSKQSIIFLVGFKGGKVAGILDIRCIDILEYLSISPGLLCSATSSNGMHNFDCNLDS